MCTRCLLNSEQAHEHAAQMIPEKVTFWVKRYYEVKGECTSKTAENFFRVYAKWPCLGVRHMQGTPPLPHHSWLTFHTVYSLACDLGSALRTLGVQPRQVCKMWFLRGQFCTPRCVSILLCSLCGVSVCRCAMNVCIPE
jgi:hypothetical protein